MATYGQPNNPFPEESLFEQIIKYHRGGVPGFALRPSRFFFAFEITAPVSGSLFGSGFANELELPGVPRGAPAGGGFYSGSSNEYFIDVIDLFDVFPFFIGSPPPHTNIQLNWDVSFACYYFWQVGCPAPSYFEAPIDAPTSLGHLGAQIATNSDGMVNPSRNVDGTLNYVSASIVNRSGSGTTGNGSIGSSTTSNLPGGWGLLFAGFDPRKVNLNSVWSCTASFTPSLVPA